MPLKDATISINGLTYACTDWALIEEGELLEQTWDQGFPNGQSDYIFRSPTRYFASLRMDLSSLPYVRLGLAKSATISTSTIDTSNPAYAFMAKSADGSAFGYILNDRRAHKIRLSNNTAETVHDFGANAVCGRWALFEGDYYVGLGTTVNARKLTAIGNPGNADTWTDTGELALHFANDTQDGIARLARAHSVNQISFSSSGASGSWGGGFEVADSSLPIIDLLPWMNELAVINAESVYRFDNDGNAYPVQSFVGRTGDPNVTITMSASHGPFLYWMHVSGPWRVFEDTARPIGPSSQVGWTHQVVDLMRPILDVGWHSVATVGRFIYATVSEGIVNGYIRDDGTVIWYGVFAVPGADPVYVMITEDANTTPILWAVDTDNIYIYDLNVDGGMRSVIVAGQHGEADTAHGIVTPATHMGVGINKLKQARMLWVQTENWPSSNIPLELRLVRERALFGVQIGADINGSGYFERTLTPGTNDTFYEASMSLIARSNVSYSAADPLIRAFGMQAVTASLYLATLTLTPASAKGRNRSVKTMLKELRDLKSGPQIVVRDPENPSSTFNAQVVGVAETAVDAGAGQVGYTVQVRLERFDWGKGV